MARSGLWCVAWRRVGVAIVAAWRPYERVLLRPWGYVWGACVCVCVWGVISHYPNGIVACGVACTQDDRVLHRNSEWVKAIYTSGYVCVHALRAGMRACMNCVHA